MKYVLDSSAFFAGLAPEGDLFTTHSVVREIRDLASKGRYEALLAGGLSVINPSPDALQRIDESARHTRDEGKLSPTDRELLALALEIPATIITDDFAVQNVALQMGIPVRSITQRRAKHYIWRFRCRGCGSYSADPGECQICGSEMKRTLK